MTDTTLRVRTQAQLQDLLEYGRAVKMVRQEIEGLTTAAQRHNVTTGAAGAGGAPGAPAVPGGPPAPGQAAARAAAAMPSVPQGIPRSPWARQLGFEPGAPERMDPKEIPGRAPRTFGGGFLQTAAATAVGVGLGGSISGFFLGSAQKYMELSRIITHLGRRFRDLDDDTTSWGMSLGYTRAQAGQLIDTLAQGTNRMDRGQFQEVLGFARERGADPGGTARLVGRVSRLSGRQVGTDFLAGLAGRADAFGMGQGRFGEEMQAAQAMAEMQFGARGFVDPSQIGAMMTTPNIIFGNDDPRGMGMEGVDFSRRLQGVMTGGGPLQTFLMRSMGYGRPGSNIDYMTMRERTEAGITDPRNLASIFGSFQAQGMGEGAMFRSIEGVAGGRLKAHEIRALVRTLGSAEGLQRYTQAFAGGDAAAREEYLESLSPEDRAAFESGGFGGLGGRPGRVSGGDVFGVKSEQLQMAVGRPVAEAMIDMKDAMMSIVGVAENLGGAGFGDLLTGVSGNLARLADALEAATEPGGRAGLRDIDVRSGDIMREEGVAAGLEFLRIVWTEDVEAARKHPEWFNVAGEQR